jgi:hypothetical protein
VEVNGCLHAGVEEFEYFFTGDEVVPHGVLADNVKAQENKKVKARWVVADGKRAAVAIQAGLRVIMRTIFSRAASHMVWINQRFNVLPEPSFLAGNCALTYAGFRRALLTLDMVFRVWSSQFMPGEGVLFSEPYSRSTCREERESAELPVLDVDINFPWSDLMHVHWQSSS